MIAACRRVRTLYAARCLSVFDVGRRLALALFVLENGSTTTTTVQCVKRRCTRGWLISVIRPEIRGRCITVVANASRWTWTRTCRSSLLNVHRIRRLLLNYAMEMLRPLLFAVEGQARIVHRRRRRHAVNLVSRWVCLIRVVRSRAAPTRCRMFIRRTSPFILTDPVVRALLSTEQQNSEQPSSHDFCVHNDTVTDDSLSDD